MTWTLTAQVAVAAAVLAGAGLLYARHLARQFDRRYGRSGHRTPAE